ncbi:hypothetical protein K4H28_02465 [Deefgea tanakiae]|uniref:Uncharacterized protein n=1 Tax=Deefgea tanakiae TaxID=2865840 RepID=A0ABX8ZAV7_9NEIS|nr:hypothetical protein [Deefgea tanakiae]QZA78300.1 hypothetical protein K4H28_02465 [Deefgea tanakiae]
MKKIASMILGLALVTGTAQAAEEAVALTQSQNALIASVQASTGLSVAAATTLVVVGAVVVGSLVYTIAKDGDSATVSTSTTTATN